jgi:hypothetical protein
MTSFRVLPCCAVLCRGDHITTDDRRFFDELRGLGLKNNKYLHATQSGAKASVNYMNVLASKNSINQHGEGRVCKMLARQGCGADCDKQKKKRVVTGQKKKLMPNVFA